MLFELLLWRCSLLDLRPKSQAAKQSAAVARPSQNLSQGQLPATSAFTIPDAKADKPSPKKETRAAARASIWCSVELVSRSTAISEYLIPLESGG